jgi:ribose/xylose/arabinose/galactoside ABC-type transport system permease subunit
MEMDVIAAVVMGGTPLIGGTGKVLGTIFGCLIVGVINNGLNIMNVDANWQSVAKGLLILLAVIMDSQSRKIFKK